MGLHRFCSFLSNSLPLSLAFPTVPSLLAVVIFTTWLTFPGFEMPRFTQTVKYKLSLVGTLACEWLLQNLSVLVMGFSYRDTNWPCWHFDVPAHSCGRLFVCLSWFSSQCHLICFCSTIPLSRYLTSYAHKTCQAPLPSTLERWFSSGRSSTSRTSTSSELGGNADCRALARPADSQTLGAGPSNLFSQWPTCWSARATA